MKKRVFDVPSSENALTGVSIGAAISGIRSVVTHQRLDFFLLAMDQLVNSASKWHFMFGGALKVPITIRLIIGRGWGQGPTHSQNLHSWFANIPGLKVVMPTFAQDAEELLLKSIFDPNPVIFLEQRWLHSFKNKKFKNKIKKIGESRLVRKGEDCTIISMSYYTIEALEAAKILSIKYNIKCEIIDLVSIKPIDYNKIFKSIKKTKRVIVIDTGFAICSIASEIISELSLKFLNILKTKPIKLSMPDMPVPTSYGLTKNLYHDKKSIIETVLKIFNKKKLYSELRDKKFHDIPGEWFKGPF